MVITVTKSVISQTIFLNGMIVSVMICAVFGYGKVVKGVPLQNVLLARAIFLNEKDAYRMVA